MQLFDLVDKDKNGTIDRDELQELVELLLGYGVTHSYTLTTPIIRYVQMIL